MCKLYFFIRKKYSNFVDIIYTNILYNSKRSQPPPPQIMCYAFVCRILFISYKTPRNIKFFLHNVTSSISNRGIFPFTYKSGGFFLCSLFFRFVFCSRNTYFFLFIVLYASLLHTWNWAIKMTLF